MRAVKAAGDRKKIRPKVFRIKVISMGDTAVGKSCLIKRCLGWDLGVALHGDFPGCMDAVKRNNACMHADGRTACDRPLSLRMCLAPTCLAPHCPASSLAHGSPPSPAPRSGIPPCPQGWLPPPPLPLRYCEEKFVQKYIPTIGVDYGVKPVKLGDYEVSVAAVQTLQRNAPRQRHQVADGGVTGGWLSVWVGGDWVRAAIIIIRPGQRKPLWTLWHKQGGIKRGGGLPAALPL